MIRVLVTGAAGKMGREVVKTVTAAEGMSVVAAVDPGCDGLSVDDGSGNQIVCTGDLAAAITMHAPNVMVDFTHPDAVEGNLRIALQAGVDCVVGTTGLSEGQLRALASDAPEGTCLFVAPNFAIGAVLMMRFAQEAARFMPHVEIIELHHDKKADAPSGTALRTASLIAAGRCDVPEVPGKETEITPGARGAFVDDIAIHSVRLPGLVAHQEILFGGQGQTLSLRHDSIDRTSFMPGVVLAVSGVGGLSGLVIGLETLMGE
ncbi:MAG: 4-hydroxy-tetrahydrodipicolinate reductase [Actinobacteria bacterium HGW-Actinobacteria-9]|jgi:4-hydroxy-tetrahydrodipicolinate reductase|nr:MAG: 4-hydroxy-tetrahydrodipicolinate reductase [Actinobacteria bacterium HGW-Actinobacteria-9]